MMPSSTNRRGLVLRYKNGIAISMDGKGPWRDNNVSVERLWRSVKYGQGLRQRVRGPHIAIGLVHRVSNARRKDTGAAGPSVAPIPVLGASRCSALCGP